VIGEERRMMKKEEKKKADTFRTGCAPPPRGGPTINCAPLLLRPPYVDAPISPPLEKARVAPPLKNHFYKRLKAHALSTPSKNKPRFGQKKSPGILSPTLKNSKTPPPNNLEGSNPH